MKKVKLHTLRDEQMFKRSLYSHIYYEVERKVKGKVIYSSLNSGRTFYGDKNMIVFI